MKHKHQIDFVKPIDYYYEDHYSYKNYIEKAEYNWQKFEGKKYNEKTDSWQNVIFTNKKINFRIKIHLGEKNRYDPFNEFPHLPKTYQEYKKINVNLISTIFFKHFKDYELFEILAILSTELPFIDFKYFNIGEKYGYEDYTIVKHDNKIIKYFDIISDNKRYKIYEYYLKYKSDKSESEMASIVEEYLYNLEFETEKIRDEEQRKIDYENNYHLRETYSIEDSYIDGGGGDEWSDPSEFW